MARPRSPAGAISASHDMVSGWPTPSPSPSRTTRTTVPATGIGTATVAIDTAEGGQVDQRDVDGGEHHAADGQRPQQAGEAQQGAHAAGPGGAAGALPDREPQHGGAPEQQDGDPRGPDEDRTG